VVVSFVGVGVGVSPVGKIVVGTGVEVWVGAAVEVGSGMSVGV
jgi:hypothetical protein